MSQDTSSHDLLVLTSDIVSAYAANNSIDPSDLTKLIQDVHSTISKLHQGVVEEPVADVQMPAISIKKSITPDYLVCLEDGKKFKSLKRHLNTTYGMSPDDYRTKWNLPSDYPMVAPNYAAQRSALAKSLGLGQLRKSIDKK